MVFFLSALFNCFVLPNFLSLLKLYGKAQIARIDFGILLAKVFCSQVYRKNFSLFLSRYQNFEQNCAQIDYPIIVGLKYFFANNKQDCLYQGKALNVSTAF